MIEANDTKPDTGERPPEASGSDARAAARPGAAFDSTDTGHAALASAGGSFTAADAPAIPASSTTADDAAHDVHPTSDIEPLVLQPDFKANDKSQYHVAELLAYHDRHFIEGVYRAILGRAPFESERARELDDLRSGRAGKVEIIERMLASPGARAAARRVRIEGLPSPLLRRLGDVPVIGYVLRLLRALVRLPLLMQHQQQFEIYALAQQQLIADYLNRTLAGFARAGEVAGDTPPAPVAPPPSQDEDIVETLAMFSDALLELSNSHAELQEQTQTQVEQAQAALAELTGAITAHQQLAETLRREQQTANDALRREQQLAADAQQEFLIQEQRVIVETQKVVLAELREELRELSERQQRARDEFDAELRRLGSLQAAARENFSGQA